MVSVAEIVQNIYGYLRNEQSLESFRDWMVGAELQLEAAGENHPARQLVWQLEAHYAELSDGIVDEASWQKILRHLAQEQRPGSEPNVVASIQIFIPSVWAFHTVTQTQNSIPKAEPELVMSTEAA